VQAEQVISVSLGGVFSTQFPVFMELGLAGRQQHFHLPSSEQGITGPTSLEVLVCSLLAL